MSNHRTWGFSVGRWHDALSNRIEVVAAKLRAVGEAANPLRRRLADARTALGREEWGEVTATLDEIEGALRGQ